MPLPQPREIHQLRELFRKAKSYAQNDTLGSQTGEESREDLYANLSAQVKRFETLIYSTSSPDSHKIFHFWATDRFSKSTAGDFYGWMEANSQRDVLLILFLNPRVKDESFLEALNQVEITKLPPPEILAEYQKSLTTTPDQSQTTKAVTKPTTHAAPVSSGGSHPLSVQENLPVAETPQEGVVEEVGVPVVASIPSSMPTPTFNEDMFDDMAGSAGSFSGSLPNLGPVVRPSLGDNIQSAINSFKDPESPFGDVASSVRRGAEGLGSQAQIGAKKLMARAPERIGRGLSEAFPGIFSSNPLGTAIGKSVGKKLAQGAAGQIAKKGLSALAGNALVPGAGTLLAFLPIPWGKIVIGIGVALLLLLVGPLAAVTNLTQPRLMGEFLGTYSMAEASTGETPTTTPGGGSCPTPEAIKANRQSPQTCKYFGLGVDLFNTSISSSAIETYVSKYSPTFIKAGKGDLAEFRKRVDYIVQASKTAGLNPVLFLGYWKTESLFGTVSTRELGCVGDNFNEQVDCALGINAFSDPVKNPIANCARSKDAESVACKTLKGIRNKPFLDPQNPISYPIKTFDDFAEAHGSRAPELDGGATNNNCVATYNSLVEVAIELNACQVGGAQVSAPAASSDKQQLKNDILAKFGVDMDLSFSYEYLKWTWEKLWNVSNSKFLTLVRGESNKIITIARSDGSYNQQVSCTQINMSGASSAGSLYPESLFKVVLIHELAHIIENCHPAANKNRLQQIIDQEGYLTSYSKNAAACAVTRSNPLNENYAETVSYYLNPEYPEQDIGLCPSFKPVDNLNPYKRNVPLHTQFAQELLGVGATQPPGSTTSPIANFSCPVRGGGKNRTPSFQKDSVNGHCGSAYNSQLTDQADRCVGNTRRGKSIDIETGGPNGKVVELPTIDGKSVTWRYLSTFALQGKDCFAGEIVETGVGEGCGVGLVFKTDLANGQNWVLHLLHMQQTSLTLNQSYPSGTAVGNSQAIHVHISLGQNIQDPMSQAESGWKSVDQELNVCNSR